MGKMNLTELEREIAGGDTQSHRACGGRAPGQADPDG
jgi:hypothetical protein